MTILKKITSLYAKVREEMGTADTFCILPWIQVDISESGIGRMCCFSPPITIDNMPAAIDYYSLDAIYNSEFIRKVRENMVHGKRVAACSVCYLNEKTQGTSRRIKQNEKWQKKLSLDFDRIKKEAIAGNYKITVQPSYIQLHIGNFCNLKCRMCHAGNSILVSKDPIQSSWSPARYAKERLYWQDNKISLLPVPFIGCTYEGFAGLTFNAPEHQAVFQQQCHLVLPIFADTALDNIVMTLVADKDTEGLVFTCNGKVLGELALIAGQTRTVQYDLKEFMDADKIDLTLTTSSANTIRIDRLDIFRKVAPATLAPSGRSAGEESGDNDLTVFSRFGADKKKNSENAVDKELMAALPHLRQISFTGGEPLLSSVMEHILDTIFIAKKEKDITLGINTNLTTLPDKLFAKILLFQNVQFNLSVDAIGGTYEYIRYPSKWARVSSNITTVSRFESINLMAVPIVQAYNLLNLVELCRYFTQTGIDYTLVMLHGPYFVHSAVLPDPIRHVAAARLRDYADQEAPAAKKDHLLAMANTIATIAPQFDRQQAFNDFMLFTNDIDKANGQNFRESLPELWNLLNKEGIRWIDKTRFA